MQQNNDFLEPLITLIADCHTCGEKVRFGFEKCPNCGIELDQEALFPSVVQNFVLTQAVSSANTIRTLDPAVFFFLGTALIRYVIAYPLWWNLATTIFWFGPPVLIIRWFYKHGRWGIENQEYKNAGKEMWAGLKFWAVSHVFNAIIIIGSWLWNNEKAG